MRSALIFCFTHPWCSGVRNGVLRSGFLEKDEQCGTDQQWLKMWLKLFLLSSVKGDLTGTQIRCVSQKGVADVILKDQVGP